MNATLMKLLASAVLAMLIAVVISLTPLQPVPGVVVAVPAGVVVVATSRRRRQAK